MYCYSLSLLRLPSKYFPTTTTTTKTIEVEKNDEMMNDEKNKIK